MTHDRSLHAILAAKVATIAAALVFDWGLGQLRWPYWNRFATRSLPNALSWKLRLNVPDRPAIGCVADSPVG